MTSLTPLLHTVHTLAQDTPDYTAPAQPGPMFWIFETAIILLMVISMWKIFAKAGQPGWASIIPIYNIYILTKIVGRPGWWIILLLVPCVNIIFAIILCVDLAKSFGQGVGFAIGLILLGIIFFPILAFGGYTYQGPAAGKPATA